LARLAGLLARLLLAATLLLATLARLRGVLLLLTRIVLLLLARIRVLVLLAHSSLLGVLPPTENNVPHRDFVPAIAVNLLAAKTKRRDADQRHSN
jgi:hypothetical protein